MNIREYYGQVFPRLANGFQDCHYVLGYGLELIAYGWDPDSLLVTVEPVDQLWDLTVNKGLEVFIPVIGHDSDSVMMPFDFEIYLADVARLYADPGSQYWYFHNYVAPVKDYLCDEFERFGIPHVLDYTPSGGHFLVRVARGTAAWDALARIGYVPETALAGYVYHDPGDLKRNPPIKPDAAYVYSGITHLAEYLAFRTIQEVPHDTHFPITLWDSREKCVNIDLSWTADPAYMRIIRAPFSAHKKRSQRFHLGRETLVDVMGRYYDGYRDVRMDDMAFVSHCFWDLEMAADHAENFSGFIPYGDEGIVALVDEYCRSPLKAFHDTCYHGESDLMPGEGAYRVLNDPRLTEKTKHMVMLPYPRMLQPFSVRLFVEDLTMHGWHPRHIQNVIAEKYRENHGWGIDFMKYNPDMKAWAFARQYAAKAHLLREGWTV